MRRPDEACPLCGLHWRYFAGNRDSCGPQNYRQPGCFAALSEPEDVQTVTSAEDPGSNAAARNGPSGSLSACGAVLISCSRQPGHDGPHASASGSEWFGPPPARPEPSGEGAQQKDGES